jgi:hypothetical protein
MILSYVVNASELDIRTYNFVRPRRDEGPTFLTPLLDDSTFSSDDEIHQIDPQRSYI